MTSSIRKSACLLLTAAMFAALYAVPQVKIENETFDAGSVSENTKINAVFQLTNTGTQPLRVTQVRPDCGCTVADYDTLIAPGKTGVIKSAVDLKGMRPGLMRRGVNVTTNSAENPTFKLTIAATIIPTIEVSEGYLTFVNAQAQTITLSSSKKDLKVNGVTFTPHSGGGTPGWASNSPLTLDYKFTTSNSTREDGLRVYDLNITPPDTRGETVIGVFRITTNHPNKKEIIIHGRSQ
ncbi:MAG: DUF1573 domain-containing protein [Clostridia bacterium]|nr:DUF1573 domain-containing protein [Clostridia bacterium]